MRKDRRRPVGHVQSGGSEDVTVSRRRPRPPIHVQQARLRVVGVHPMG